MNSHVWDASNRTGHVQVLGDCSVMLYAQLLTHVGCHGCSVDVHDQWHLSRLGLSPGLAGGRPQPKFLDLHKYYIPMFQYKSKVYALSKDYAKV